MESSGQLGSQGQSAWEISDKVLDKVLDKECSSNSTSPSRTCSGGRYKGLSVKEQSSSPELNRVPYSEAPSRSLRTSAVSKSTEPVPVAAVQARVSATTGYVPDAFDPVFRASWDESKYRYRLPELPDPDPNLETYDSDDLSGRDYESLIGFQACCEAGVDALKEILSGHSRLYEWLIFKSRQIELMNAPDKQPDAAARWACTLDDACKNSEFNWRKLPLALNYEHCSESRCRKLFPGDKLEKKRLREEVGILFFPPWVEKSFKGMPLSTLYSRYWGVRNTLGHKDRDLNVKCEDFLALYPNLNSWLMQFQNATPGELERAGLSRLEVEAFKYLLDKTDEVVNSVKKNPQWCWRNAVSSTSRAEYPVSDDVLACIQDQDYLFDIDHPAPQSPVDQLPEATGTFVREPAKKRQARPVNTDPLSADPSVHFQLDEGEKRKRTVVQREGVLSWEYVTTSMITAQDPVPTKKCKLTVESSEPVDVEAGWLAGRAQCQLTVESKTQTVVAEPETVGKQSLLTSAGASGLLAAQEEGWSGSSSSSSSDNKTDESGYLADDEMDIGREGLESVWVSLINEVDYYPKSSAIVTRADLLNGLPRRDEIRVALECVPLTGAYAGTVDFFELDKRDDIELLEPVASLTNWVRGLESELSSRINQEAILLRTINRAKEAAESPVPRLAKMAPSRLRQKEQQLESTIARNDEFMEPHLEAFALINNGLRQRLEQVEKFVAEKVKAHFIMGTAPANLKEELSGLRAIMDSAYEVLGNFEVELEYLQQYEDHQARVEACQLLKDFDFSVFNEFI